MRKLTTDVTYIPCSDQKFIYVSPLLDLFNHEVVSYSISAVNSEEFVRRMLTALPPEALKDALIHNDQGSVYWSNGWVKLCEELQVVRSMSRRGNCWDNALSENFFSGMKVDLGLTKQGYKTLLPAKEVRALVNDYMPWYNTERIQKKLNYMSPVHYRESFLDKRLRANGIVSSCASPALAGQWNRLLMRKPSGSDFRGWGGGCAPRAFGPPLRGRRFPAAPSPHVVPT